MKSKNEIKELIVAERNKGDCLVVHSPFREYKRGDRIHNADEINKILECHESNMVNKSQFNYE